MDGAVVKLDALADPDGAGAQDDDGFLPRPGEGPGVAVIVVGSIEIGGLGLELSGAGVHHFVAGQAMGEGGLVHAGEPGQGLVGIAVLLALEVFLLINACSQGHLKVRQVFQLGQEPFVDHGELVDTLNGDALFQPLEDGEEPQVIHGGDPLLQIPAGGIRVIQGVQLDLRPSDRFHQGGLKGVLDGHDLAGGLHLGAQLPAGPVELVEGPLGELADHVVDGGLEAGEGFPGDVVLDLVQAVAQGDLSRDLGDGITGSLGGQGGGPGDSGVDLDDGVLKALGVQGKLAVAAALDAQGVDDLQRGGPEHLILLVHKGQGGRDNDGVAGMDAHRVHVLHGADGDGGALVVPHDLKLDLLPPEDVLFDQDLGDGGVVQTDLALLPQLFLVVSHAAAAAAQGEGGADDHGIADAVGDLHAGLNVVGGVGGDGGLPDGGHGILEDLPVLGLVDGVGVGADEPDVVGGQEALVGQLHGDGQASLSSQTRQKAVGLGFLNDALDGLGGQGLQVHRVGHGAVGHDRCRVGVDQHGLHALSLQNPAGLGAGIVELGGLADDDGAGTDDKDFFNGSISRHYNPSFIISVKRSKAVRVSRGPPWASGWNCREKA